MNDQLYERRGGNGGSAQEVRSTPLTEFARQFKTGLGNKRGGPFAACREGDASSAFTTPIINPFHKQKAIASSSCLAE